MKNRLILFLAFLLLISTCSQRVGIQKHVLLNNRNWVERTLKSMTLEQKIGQMILMTFRPTYMSDSSNAWLTIKNDIVNNHVFGYHIWSGEIFAARHYIKKMQNLAEIPLVFSADFERGVGIKFDGAVEFPPNMAFGATGKTDYAYKLGASTAIEGRAIGFSMVFAPVADINNNPNNPIINTRSFGETPELVSEMVQAFIKGTHDHQYAATVKHFPGHGDTETDSHIDLAAIYGKRSRLDQIELAPFKAAIKCGVDAIMTAHIYVPELEKEPGIPATLSSEILTDLLREELGFEGIIITDAMSMGGIKNNFTENYALINAIQSGCDLIINSGRDATAAVNVIKTAVKKGKISEERINISVKRLLTLKAKLGLHKNRYVDIRSEDNVIGNPKTAEFARQVADEAVTLVKDDRNLLPLSSEIKEIVIINLHDVDTRHTENRFQRELSAIYPDAGVFTLDLSDDKEDFEQVAQSIPDNALVVIGAFARYGAYKGHIDLPEIQTEFVNQLLKKTSNIIVYSFGNPYILRQFPDISTYVCGFGWQDISQRAAVKALTGQIAISGKMPVTIPSIINFGEGLQRTAVIKSFEPPYPRSVSLKIRKGFPDEVGINTSKLSELEQLLEQGLVDSAYPGGVFLAAKDGVVFAEIPFGHLNYESNTPSVNRWTIYDIASVTKPVATTSAAMLLYDQGLLNLDEKVVETIPEFGQNGKDRVTIRHLLTHSSGLPAFIQLWKVADTPEAMLRQIYQCQPEYIAGEKSVYSCLGMIMLQKVIETKTGQALDTFLSENLFQPLQMIHTFYNPPAKYFDNIAPTEYDPERGGIVHGKVHDENAYYLGGVSGNAGLFSTAWDLAKFAQMLLNKGQYGDQRIFNESTVELFTKRQNLIKVSDRALGWGTPSEKSSSGQYFSENSYGHTGFTGTSIWIDPEKNLIGILLTNRVHPTRENRKIYEFRYKIYNLLQESVTD